jgi:hypothetical protein
MGHLVQFRTPAGELRHEDASDLDAALALVERLRNEDRVEDVRVFVEVPLQFETFVKVSVAGVATPEPAPEPEAAAAPPPATVLEPPPGAMLLTVPAPSELAEADKPKRGLFHG